MNINLLATIAILPVLSLFFADAAASDYALLEIIPIDDGGDPGSESSPRLFAHDPNADLLYISSHRFVNGVLDGRLLVVEPDSGTLIDGISYNYGSSYGLVAAADGKRVYVSRSAYRSGGGVPSVRVFDTDPASLSFRSEIGPINTGGSVYGPDASAITPDGSRIYVTHRGSFVIHAIDTSNHSVSNIPVPAGNGNGSQLSGIAITPDGKRAYAVNRTNHTVVVIDTDPSSATYNTVIAVVRTSNGASGNLSAIAISPDGRFAYTLQNSDPECSVIDIDPGSPSFHTEVAKIALSGSSHISVAVTPDNLTLFVSSPSSDELLIIDVDPNSPTFRTEVGTISFPTGSDPRHVTVITEGSAAGSVYVSLPGGQAIARIGIENPNTPPVARSGDDQSIRVGETVFLDGSSSFDDNTASVDLEYEWSFSAVPTGSPAVLTDADTATPSFVTDVAGTYYVLLEVTDEGGLTATAELMISSDNLAATAVATADFAIYIVGDTAFLDGTGSSDPESDTLSYDWSLVAPAGSASTFSDPTSPTPTLLLDVVGTYDISLTVSDFIGPGAPVTISIVATAAEDFAVIQIINTSDIVLDLSPGQVTTGGNQTAIGNFFQQAIAAINNDDLAKATDKLEKARERTDGCVLRGLPDTNGAGRDWVIDCAVQEELYGLLTDAINALNP